MLESLKQANNWFIAGVAAFLASRFLLIENLLTWNNFQFFMGSLLFLTVWHYIIDKLIDHMHSFSPPSSTNSLRSFGRKRLIDPLRRVITGRIAVEAYRETSKYLIAASTGAVVGAVFRWNDPRSIAMLVIVFLLLFLTEVFILINVPDSTQPATKEELQNVVQEAIVTEGSEETQKNRTD